MAFGLPGFKASLGLGVLGCIGEFPVRLRHIVSPDITSLLVLAVAVVLSSASGTADWHISSNFLPNLDTVDQVAALVSHNAHRTFGIGDPIVSRQNMKDSPVIILSNVGLMFHPEIAQR